MIHRSLRAAYVCERASCGVREGDVEGGATDAFVVGEPDVAVVFGDDGFGDVEAEANA